MLAAAHLLTLAAMVALPAGAYRPLYGHAGDASRRVAAFRLDRDPVTRGDFLAFVRTHPEWRRSSVAPRVAERDRYLADWRDDLDPSPRAVTESRDAAALRRPVTDVSWFAAQAYCEAQGKRLPTLVEWEYAAAASESKRDAARDPSFIQRLVSRYASRGQSHATVDAGVRNAYGVRGLHDFGWEWTADDGIDRHPHGGAHGAAHDDAPDASCAGAAIGAADATNYPAFLRFAMRAGLTSRTSLSSLGFRCAR
jgi:formylglycine-generating enzyme required for sulfatase activity